MFHLRKLQILFIQFLLILLVSLINCRKNSTPYTMETGENGYPRLAMWWPDTWEQPLSDLQRYD